MFNKDEFLNSEQTGATDSRYIPHPVGDFPGLITALNARQQPSQDDPTKLWTMLDITYTTDDARAKEVTGLDKPSARQTLFLDLNAEGKLDFSKGKNVPLGKVRDATGTNDPDQAFTLSMLMNKPVIYTVVHKPNKDDPETPYANVSKVGTL